MERVHKHLMEENDNNWGLRTFEENYMGFLIIISWTHLYLYDSVDFLFQNLMYSHAFVKVFMTIVFEYKYKYL